MRITKYGHSCLLLEEGDEKLLIDPGFFVFADGTVKPKDIPQPNAVLLTHEHRDHYYPEALKTILNGVPVPVLANADLAENVRAEGLHAIATRDSEIHTFGAFTVRTIPAEHGDLPVPKPFNTGFVVNDMIYHPGDSLVGDIPYSSVPVLALPFMSPWGTTKLAYDYAIAIKPKIVIPIHDGYVKSFFLDSLYQQGVAVLEPHNITFHPLRPKESLDV